MIFLYIVFTYRYATVIANKEKGVLKLKLILLHWLDNNEVILTEDAGDHYYNKNKNKDHTRVG